MALFVQKFGGTSVANIERIQAVANRVVAYRQAGHQVVVVLSAMSGETNRLLDLAHGLGEEPSLREIDALVSTGEQVTTALLSIALNQLGVKAKSFSGAQAGIKTDGFYGKARIKHIAAEILQAEIDQDVLPIVAGFQGLAENGDTNTLGRGGSDTTAVAIAAAISADECQIYTDVDGVYTTDPRVCKSARRLKHLTFEEMLEMASLGSKVLQIRSVKFAGKYNIPLRVLSSYSDNLIGLENGTLISSEGEDKVEKPVISGIAFNRDEAKLTLRGVPDKPGVASAILGPIGDANIEVDMIVQNIGSELSNDLTFTVNRADFPRAKKVLEGLNGKALIQEIVGDDNIAKVSLVGVGMRSHAGVASRMFEVLAGEGINIQMISTSEIKISVVIDQKYLELAVRALHQAFDLERA